MEKPKNKENTEEWLKNLPVQTESPAFSPKQMISCGNCQRKNPPTRLKCLYCGTELEISEVQARAIKPNLRKMEIWENGFNLIYLPNDGRFERKNILNISKTLGIEPKALEKILEAEKVLPIARAETKRNVEIVQQNLSDLGIMTIILSDQVIDAKNPPKRIRGIEFFADKINLLLFNQEKTAQFAVEDIYLIVTGKIFERKVEAVEKYKRRGENKILRAMETAFDEFLIDIYSRREAGGFRVLEKGFDFSCLGAEKELLASKNMPKLIEKLKTFLPNAKFVDDYVGVRQFLGGIWEIENRTDSLGFSRKGFGNLNLENASTANNLTQFTKYSRLQRHII